MAMTLRLVTSDGSENTVDLADGIYTGVFAYVPKPPAIGAASVVETAKINFFGASTPDQRTKLAMISRMFNLARARRESGIGPRVFVEFEVSSLATAYRSEIYDGIAPDLSDETLGYMLASNEIEANISWTRAPWWEGPETQIALTNGNGTNNVSGLTLQNSDDGAGDNWFTIPTTEMLSNYSGDIETPVKLEITNSTNQASVNLRGNRYFIGMLKSNSYASNRVPTLEGESGTAGGGVTTSTTGTTAAASNSSYRTLTWSGSTETTLVTWTLTGADLERMRGQRFIPILRFAQSLPASDIDFRWKVLYTTTSIARGGFMRGNTINLLLPLTGVQLPPYTLTGITGQSALTFALTAKRAAGGSTSILLDSVHLMPADKMHGGFRALQTLGYGLVYTAKIIDNGIDGMLYSDETPAGGAIQSHYYADGDPLTLRPNCTNQFYILHDTLGGTADANRTITVKAWYRPRRSTI
jgi:hypothetical protein